MESSGAAAGCGSAAGGVSGKGGAVPGCVACSCIRRRMRRLLTAEGFSVPVSAGGAGITGDALCSGGTGSVCCQGAGCGAGGVLRVMVWLRRTASRRRCSSSSGVI